MAKVQCQGELKSWLFLLFFLALMEKFLLSSAAHPYKEFQETLDHITNALANGRDVELRNFGVFEVRLTRPRVGHNPKRPDIDVTIPARTTVKFKSGKIMREQVLLRTEELKKAQIRKDNITI